ncbi:tetraacyldisaccharide 4'-kinase [bacterium]|nr:tetraacyldisaccharide 4'-kinase [bacterium]
MKRGLSVIYRAVTTGRNMLYDVELFPTSSISLPVLCVGNVAVGGSGKTPLVLALVSLLKQDGRAPVILLRGYGGRERGPFHLQPSSSAEQVGDEACLHQLKSRVPVVVAQSRVAGARYIEQEKLGDIIVLDDGFQHRALQRDLNILTFDVRDPQVQRDLREDRMLPWGVLREPLAAALQRADLLVYNHRGPELSAEEIRLPKLLQDSPLPAFHCWISGMSVQNAAQEVLSPTEVVAVSGIARPSGFLRLLEEHSFVVLHHEEFRDHEPFSLAKIAALREQFPDTPFLCTEKDFMRLPPSERTRWWSVVPNYTVGEEEQFAEVILRSTVRDRG